MRTAIQQYQPSAPRGPHWHRSQAALILLKTEGNETMTERVQTPAYTDAWMMGDRYGEVVKVTKLRKNFPSGSHVSADAKGTYLEIAHVKLDKSGKTLRFVYADCTPV